MAIKREYININLYKPTKRSDSISRKIILKLAQTFREKLEASVYVITLRLSKNFFDCSRDVDGNALRGEREREREPRFGGVPSSSIFLSFRRRTRSPHCNPRSKHLSHDTRGLFSRDHVQLLTEHTSTRERVREKGGCVKGLIDRSH